MREHVKIISNYTKISTHKERFSYIINKSITNRCTWILCVVFHLFLRQYQSMHKFMRTNDQHFSNKTSRNKNNEILFCIITYTCSIKCFHNNFKRIRNPCKEIHVTLSCSRMFLSTATDTCHKSPEKIQNGGDQKYTMFCFGVVYILISSLSVLFLVSRISNTFNYVYTGS